MIAALYVATGGVYYGLPDVDPWDEARDARLYDGPWPVVAHPPCSRWCQLAAINEARWGAMRGDDGGCFEAALASVRRWGGVLEHPAYSLAWRRYDLLEPPESGGWVRDFAGAWTAYVEQGRYGHPARKATWLYVIRAEPPALRWGRGYRGEAIVSGCSAGYDTDRPRLQKGASSGTPLEFRDVLLDIARSVQR